MPSVSGKFGNHLEEQQPNTDEEEQEHIRRATGESIQLAWTKEAAHALYIAIQRAIEQLIGQKYVGFTGDGRAGPSTNQAKGTPVSNTTFKNEEIIVIFVRWWERW